MHYDAPPFLRVSSFLELHRVQDGRVKTLLEPNVSMAIRFPEAETYRTFHLFCFCPPAVSIAIKRIFYGNKKVICSMHMDAEIQKKIGNSSTTDCKNPSFLRRQPRHECVGPPWCVPGCFCPPRRCLLVLLSTLPGVPASIWALFYLYLPSSRSPLEPPYKSSLSSSWCLAGALLSRPQGRGRGRSLTATSGCLPSSAPSPITPLHSSLRLSPTPPLPLLL